jgi:hypothetical protein
LKTSCRRWSFALKPPKTKHARPKEELGSFRKQSGGAFFAQIRKLRTGSGQSLDVRSLATLEIGGLIRRICRRPLHPYSVLHDPDYSAFPDLAIFSKHQFEARWDVSRVMNFEGGSVCRNVYDLTTGTRSINRDVGCLVDQLTGVFSSFWHRLPALVERDTYAALAAPHYLAGVDLFLLRDGNQRELIWNADWRSNVEGSALLRQVANGAAYRHFAKPDQGHTDYKPAFGFSGFGQINCSHHNGPALFIDSTNLASPGKASVNPVTRSPFRDNGL